MERETIGLTKEEKIMFSILGCILIIAIGILIINSFSANERTLKEETPITENEKENKKTDEDLSNEDIILKEDNNSKANATTNAIAYVTNLPTTESTSSKLENTTTKVEIEEEETSVITEWDFPESIVTTAYAGDTIKIDKKVTLKDGRQEEAQVTVRKLIIDTYMIQDISSGELTLTEGTYKYYYTYADVTKELVLNVIGYLNPEEVNFPSIIDTEETDEQDYLINLKDTLATSQVSVTNNTITLTLKEENKVAEIPLYLALNKDLNETSLASNTYGVIVNRNVANGYQELKENELVMWINLETISTASSDILINLDNTTYSVNLILNIYDSTDSKEEENQETAEDNIDYENKEDNANNEENIVLSDNKDTSLLAQQDQENNTIYLENYESELDQMEYENRSNSTNDKEENHNYLYSFNWSLENFWESLS